MAASKLTDAQLQEACSLPQAKGDIVVLKGCSSLSNLSCLELLDQMQVLDVSGCASMVALTLATALPKLK